LLLQQKKLKEHDVEESILLAERAILYSLAFQIKFDVPSEFLPKTLADVGAYSFCKDPSTESNLSEEQQNKLSQIALNFANDR